MFKVYYEKDEIVMTKNKQDQNLFENILSQKTEIVKNNKN